MISTEEIRGDCDEIREVIKSSDKMIVADIIASSDCLTMFCHGLAFASGWWHDPVTGALKDRNHGELFMLMVSEIAEAMEGKRKDMMDQHLPHRKSVEVELADTIIRIFDYAGAHFLDLGGAIAEKLAYNASRADHKPENRAKEGGKAF